MKPTRCPICKKDVARDAAAFPFCGERCRLIDLGNWLGGRYVIEGEPVSPDNLSEADSGRRTADS